ncbi:MAG: putative RNA methyltransferase, partial [Acidimicrobiales bacterium]
MHRPGLAALTAPWICPVCRGRLCLSELGQQWACPLGHSFDVAREGYVNLLLAGQRRSRQPGDSAEMVSARRRFLATGAF